MAEINPGDILRLAAVMQYQTSDDIVNVYHLQNLGTVGVTFAFAAPLLGNYMDSIMAFMTTQLSNALLPVNLSLSNVTQGTVFGSFAWGVWAGGTGSGDALPGALACLAFARTSLPRVQIRKYYGPWTESGITGGQWLSTVTTPAQQAMAYHITSQFLGTNLTVQGVAYNATLARATAGVSAHSSANPVTQRRRRRGRGS